MSAKYPESDYIIQLGNFGYKKQKARVSEPLSRSLFVVLGWLMEINEQSDTHAYVYIAYP